MRQVGGYLIGYPDAQAIMNKLEIPDKEVDVIMLQHPLNDWLAKKKRYNCVCTTVGHVYSDFKDAEGVLLITHIRTVRRDNSREPEAPVERDRDKNTKRWLMCEGGENENSLRWMAFPDGDEFRLLEGGTRPARNDFKGRWVHRRLNKDQWSRMIQSGKQMIEWGEEAIANGEEIESIWPPKGHSS